MNTRQTLGWMVSETLRCKAVVGCGALHQDFCNGRMKPVEAMGDEGFDPMLVKYRCQDCGAEEWIHPYVLALRDGGQREPPQGGTG